MISVEKCAGIMVAIGAAALAGSRIDQAQTAAKSSPNPTQSHVVFTQPLPKMDAANLKVSLVEVKYGPGGSSHEHGHPCPVIGYVIEGTYRTRVKGEPEVIYRAGQSFYEAPNRVHELSANASDKEPVRFLAYFVCDHETPLSVDVPRAERSTHQ